VTEALSRISPIWCRAERSREVYETGDTEAGSLWIGAAMGLINNIPTVGEPVSRIVTETEDIITGRLVAMITTPEAAKVPSS
jgi:hypothetical protein